MGLHQLKSFCTAKENINRIKGQPTEWENILPMIHLIRGQYPKFIKNLQNSAQKKTNNPIKNGQRI